jgi:hypothetical protein
LNQKKSNRKHRGIGVLRLLRLVRVITALQKMGKRKMKLGQLQALQKGKTKQIS